MAHSCVAVLGAREQSRERIAWRTTGDGLLSVFGLMARRQRLLAFDSGALVLVGQSLGVQVSLLVFLAHGEPFVAHLAVGAGFVVEAKM